MKVGVRMIFNNSFNKEELEWLQLAIEDNSKYRIAVDNDCISIDECIYEENDEWECAYTFFNYGQDLIVQLFNYIGCNADRV